MKMELILLDGSKVLSPVIQPNFHNQPSYKLLNTINNTGNGMVNYGLIRDFKIID